MNDVREPTTSACGKRVDAHSNMARGKRVGTPPTKARPNRVGQLASSITWFAPFTATAAALNVLALAVGGAAITDNAGQLLSTGDWSRSATWAALLLKVGVSGLSFLPVAVAAYLAHTLAGRPALVPGVLGGLTALGLQGGILAGLAAGLLSAGATAALTRVPLPTRPRLDAVVVPLLASIVTAAVLIVVVGRQLALLTDWLHQKLVWLEFHHLVLAGVLLGVMACCDLGGVVGRTAVAFGTSGISGDDPSKFNPTDMTMMAAVVAAGMVPALGMSLATLLRRRVFSAGERGYGKAAWLFGAAGLPEGAVPFALADPLRVIPAGVAGGAVAGGARDGLRRDGHRPGRRFPGRVPLGVAVPLRRRRAHRRPRDGRHRRGPQVAHQVTGSAWTP